MATLVAIVFSIYTEAIAQCLALARPRSACGSRPRSAAEGRSRLTQLLLLLVTLGWVKKQTPNSQQRVLVEKGLE